YRILTHCTSSEHPESSCVPCDRNWYMDKWNGADYCKAMNMCNKSHEVIHKAASNDGTEDNVCKCEKSYHYTDTHEFCLQNADCPPGQGSKNGLCVVCVDGTYSDVTSNTKKCKKQPDCEATGMQVIKEGNSTTPTICGLAPAQPTDAPKTFTSASTDALPTTENVISSDRSTPVIATPAPQPGAITGSGDSVWETMRGMLGGVLIIILVPIGACVVCKLRKKKQHSRNIENGLCVVCVDGTYSDVTSNTKKCKKQP
uniref:Tumor necrosis factor receptor superfamily member 11A-like n=1 Tax=Saccoglossus kowalevskii TaxID=10224 RepID=A0ABM0LV46_SACKO